MTQEPGGKRPPPEIINLLNTRMASFNPRSLEEARFKIRKCCEDLGLKVEDDFESPIEGSDGNKEFFIFARKTV